MEYPQVYCARPVPAEISYGNDFNAWPVHVKLAFDEDRSWAEEARCTDSNGKLRFAWTVLANESIELGDSTYDGSSLIALALEYCRVCPVQWECAAFAIHTSPKPEQLWGTWGADMVDLRWLKRQGPIVADAVLAEASCSQTPVQVAVHSARAESLAARKAERVMFAVVPSS
jgi:hypothetical protein